MRDLSKLSLINKTIAIAVRSAETFVGLLAGHSGKFLFADLAIGIGVSTLHELHQATSSVPTRGRPFGLSALLGAGKRNSQADEAETDDK
ncbi:MAG: hypothetical protein LW834_21780 [Cyanobium sp. 49614_E6]|nr:hypothetical protein [Cyanobium sp. 49614_E6]